MFASEESGGRPVTLSQLEKRSQRWRLESLSGEQLARMEARIEDRRSKLLERAEALERRMAGAVEAADLDLLEGLQRDFRQLERAHDELGEQIERVQAARQERVMNESLAERLGGSGRARALEIVVLVLIVLVLGLLLHELLEPDLPLRTLQTYFLIDTACCMVFLTEFALRYRAAESKRWFLRRHWIDLVTSIPLPPGGMLVRSGRLFRLARILRVARLARLLRVLRAIRIVLFFWRGMDKLRDVLDVRLMKKSLALGLGVLLLGGFSIYAIEGQSESVGNLGEAVWWSFTTVVTGGYGDIHNPVSAPGRLVTVMLVIAGMIIVGVFTATLTALLVGDESAELEMMQRELGASLESLGQRVDRLAETVGKGDGGVPEPDAGA